MKTLCVIFISLFININLIISAETPKSYIVFRFDDFHLEPTSLNYSLLDLFKKYDLPICLGIIPNKDDTLIYKFNSTQLQDFRHRIRNKEIEIGLHGYNHKDHGLHNSFSIVKNYKSEFQGRSYLDQYYRIKTAKGVLETILSCSISVFIPPWNSYDENTLKALENLNFSIMSSDLNGVTNSGHLTYIPVLIEDYYNLKYLIEHNKNNNILTVLIHPYTFASDEEFTKMSPQHYKNLESILKYIKNNPSVKVLSFSELNKTSDFNAERYNSHATKDNFFARLMAFYDKSLNKYYKTLDEQTEIKRTLNILNILFHIILFVLSFIIALFIVKKIPKNAFTIGFIASILIITLFLAYISESPAFFSLLVLFTSIELGVFSGFLFENYNKYSKVDLKLKSIINDTLYPQDYIDDVQLRG